MTSLTLSLAPIVREVMCIKKDPRQYHGTYYVSVMSLVFNTLFGCDYQIYKIKPDNLTPLSLSTILFSCSLFSVSL